MDAAVQSTNTNPAATDTALSMKDVVERAAVQTLRQIKETVVKAAPQVVKADGPTTPTMDVPVQADGPKTTE